MIKKIISFLLRHKVITVIVAIIVIFGGYYGYKKFKGNNVQISYTLATVQKGTIISSVEGSGQVSTSNQVDVKTKASGDIVYMGAVKGQEVKTGKLLAQIDAQDAQKSVRDAEANLESAKLSLEKLLQPTDALSLTQAENSLAQAQDSKQNTIDSLQKSYDDGFTAVSNAFLYLPGIITGFHDLVFNNTIVSNQANIDYYTDSTKIYDERILQYKQDVQTSYQTARASFDKNFDDYKSASRFSSTTTIESLISETYDTAKDIAEAIKNANNLIQFYVDTFSAKNIKQNANADTQLATLNTYTGQTNGYLSSLLSIENTIDTAKKNIISADRTIKEKTESLANLKAGADSLDVKSAQMTIQQRENALLDAKEQYNNYYIYAPFNGIITAVDIKKGDTVSSGATVATIITPQKIAEISLNEVDVAKVKVGQKATLTFDAVEDLSISGEVVDVDAIGTVSQGVVSYNVKINFDTQDDRVKSGMSVSASIIIDTRQDVLVVSNSAIKTQGTTKYVEMLDQNTSQNSNSTSSNKSVVSTASPIKQIVETGLSSDTLTEIISGLKEGDKIITKTTTSSSSKSSSSSSTDSQRSSNLFDLGGGGPR